MDRLPLFPLGTVLLPGRDLPLQVFEERYVALLRDLAARPADERVFGVLAIRHGHEVGPGRARDLHEVGCAAQLQGILPLADGRFHVLATGTRRFRLEAVDDGAPERYLVGLVTWLGEPDGEADEEAGRGTALAAELGREVAAYREALGGAPVAWPATPREASFLLPDAVALDLTDRQRVLAAPDTVARLELGLRLVRRERALVQALGAIPHRPDPGGVALN